MTAPTAAAARRAVGAALIATLAAGILASGAGAHAYLVGASPADGATVARSPAEVRLTFTGPLAPRVLSARVYDKRGRVVAGTHVRLAGGRELVVSLPHLRKGVYAAVWQAMSQDDGHVGGGTVVFGVGVAATAAGAALPGAPAPADALLRWLQFSFGALLIGGLAFGLVVRRSPRVTALAAVGGAGAFLANGALLLHTGAALDGRLADVATTRWGELGLAEGGVLLALTLLGRHVWPLALAYVALEALRSHAAAVGGSLPPAVLALHLLAASVWLGGLAAFVLAGGPRRRFALLAGAGAALVVATGLYELGREVASVDALLLTFYGRTALAKALLVALALALGCANALLWRRRAVVAELAAGGAVLLAAGVLAAGAPARGPEWAPPRAVTAPTLVAVRGDLIASVTIRPNRPGRNIFTVQVTSTRRPAPAAVTAAGLRLPGGGAVDLRQYAPGRYLGAGYLPSPGAARLGVVVRRGGSDLAAAVRWRVDPPDPARPVVVSPRRLESIAQPAAVLSLLAAAVAAVLAVRRSRMRVPARPVPAWRPEVRL